MPDDHALMAQYPPLAPQAALLFTAVVAVGERWDLGMGPRGHRYSVPILSGTVSAGPAGPGFDGIVLPGGADRQVIRPDGVKELDALYEIQVGNGEVVTVRNQVTVDEARTPGRYAMSVLRLTVPDGPLAWVNRRVIVGTLQSARPEVAAVIVRAWLMDV